MELQDVKLSARDMRAVRLAMAQVKDKNADGLLVPEEVVEAARKKNSPLHRHFTWDEGEAARQWRIVEARSLIRHIKQFEAEDGQETPLPKYVSLYPDRARKGGGYRETNEVVKNQELLAELEQTARRDVNGVLRRYEMLKAFCARVRAAMETK